MKTWLIMLENSHVFLGGSAKRKAILEHVSVASKENYDFVEQRLLTDDDMLNESGIAIKQGSHNKSVPKFCAIRWTTAGCRLLLSTIN